MAVRKYTLRLDDQRDSDLIQRLESARREHGYGAVSQVLRTALRQYYNGESASAGADWSSLLPQIRATVEAAVASALDGLAVSQKPSSDSIPTDETDALLDALSADLLVE